MKRSACSLKGRYKIQVLNHDGTVAQSRDWRPNLILDRGLNRLAIKQVAELFSVCAKGTGVTETREDGGGSYTLSGSAIERFSGRSFEPDDVGRLVRSDGGEECIITNYVDGDNVDVGPVGSATLGTFTTEDITVYHTDDTALEAEVERTDTYGTASGDNSTTDGTGANKHRRTYQRTFIFDPEPANLEVVTGTYTWDNEAAAPGTALVRTAGARDFTIDDVGKYVKFSATEYALISTFVNATKVTLDRSGLVTGSIELYGSNTYGEVGFDDDPAGSEVNIRCRLEDGGGLSDPVILLGENPETPGQQLKVIYEITVSVSPETTTAGSSNITGMSGSVSGSYVVEQLQLSRVDTNGDSSFDSNYLEPSVAGYLGISSSSSALVPLAGPDRSAGAQYTEMELVSAYVDDSFEIFYTGTFGLNDANATNWRTIGIYDPDGEAFGFTFLFNAAKTKDSAHTLTIRFRKSWNRDLS